MSQKHPLLPDEAAPFITFQTYPEPPPKPKKEPPKPKKKSLLSLKKK